MNTISETEIRALIKCLVAIETDVTVVLNAPGVDGVSTVTWKRLMDVRINAMVAREKFTGFAVSPLLVEVV